jgi:hypothetical protein
MADQPGAADHTTGSVRYVDPEGLHKNPAFTNVVVVEGPVRTVHVGGQNAVDGSGNIVGKGDVAAQTEQVLANLREALAAGGAGPEHVVKWNVLVVEGESPEAGFPAEPAGDHDGVRGGARQPGLSGGDGRRRSRAPVSYTLHGAWWMEKHAASRGYGPPRATRRRSVRFLPPA